MTHTVEKIGGTSMSRIDELRDTLIVGGREGDELYGRIFVVSAFGGITDLLLEHKKSGAPGAFAAFANDDNDHGWHDRLDTVAEGWRQRTLASPGESNSTDYSGSTSSGGFE